MARAAQRDVSHGQGSLGGQRRARAAGIHISNHTFRATGITAYLRNGGTLEKAALIATTPHPAPPSSTTTARMRSASMKPSAS